VLLALSELTAGTILIVVVIAVVPIAAVAFARSGSALKTLGKGQWAIERELPPSPGLTNKSTGTVSRAVREAEVRQMVEAKSYRRQARGGEPLDIDAEVARLLTESDSPGTGIDRELREEVRQLVRARNERRMRRGEQPLDVEAEVERQLRDLEGLGQ
jgi:hypothetical protein